jgi:hypothetical protein
MPISRVLQLLTESIEPSTTVALYVTSTVLVSLKHPITCTFPLTDIRTIVILNDFHVAVSFKESEAKLLQAVHQNTLSETRCLAITQQPQRIHSHIINMMCQHALYIHPVQVGLANSGDACPVKTHAPSPIQVNNF